CTGAFPTSTRACGSRGPGARARLKRRDPAGGDRREGREDGRKAGAPGEGEVRGPRYTVLVLGRAVSGPNASSAASQAAPRTPLSLLSTGMSPVARSAVRTAAPTGLPSPSTLPTSTTGVRSPGSRAASAVSVSNRAACSTIDTAAGSPSA